MVVQRKIIRKVNDNDGGRAVCVAGALVTAGRTKAAFKATAGLSVCVSTVSFGLPWRGFGLFGKLGRQNERRFIGRAVLD